VVARARHSGLVLASGASGIDNAGNGIGI
jgi:hypothetical protein